VQPQHMSTVQHTVLDGELYMHDAAVRCMYLAVSRGVLSFLGDAPPAASLVPLPLLLPVSTPAVNCAVKCATVCSSPSQQSHSSSVSVAAKRAPASCSVASLSCSVYQ
jgi:hypothetical protein